MTGMKENQSTKGTLRRRRTNKQVQADILSAVGRILQEKDFTHITLMDIAREAKTDPNVVLRQFGSLEQVFDCYIRTIDYWMHDLFGNKALKRGERSALERMFARMTDFLYNSPEMQRLLVWEITDVNDTTCRAAANRETYYREAYEAYERQFARGGEKTPFRQIASIIGKTKCDEIKNEMRPSWRKAWSKRNATKISHTRKNTVRTTTKRCSNGIFLSQKQRSLRSLLVIANHPLLLSTTTRFRGTDGPLDAVDDPPVALGVSVDHIERKHRQHKLSLHCLE